MTIPLACQEQLLPGTDLIQKYALAAALGYDAHRAARPRATSTFARRLPELRRARAAGVVMPTVCVEMDHFIGDFDPARVRATRVRNLRSQLSVIAELGGVGAMTPAAWGMFSRRLPPFEPPRSPDGDRRGAPRRPRASWANTPAPRASPSSWNRSTGTRTTWSTGSTRRSPSAPRVGLPSVRVVADTFHMNIEEDDVHRALRAAAPYLGHVQVSDSNRLQPGAGHLDWPALVRTLLELDYRGWLALECRLRGDPVRALHQAATVLRHALPRQAAA